MKMAKKEEPKTVLERTYIVPLRSSFLKKPKYKRSKKAVSALREFVQKHMKSDNVKIGKHINQFIWKHGIKNPPHHVKVTCSKDSEGVVNVELFGAKKEEKIEKKVSHIKKEKKESPIEEKLEKIKEEKEEKSKEILKEEITELKKHPFEEAERVSKERHEKIDHVKGSPKGDQGLSGPSNK